MIKGIFNFTSYTDCTQIDVYIFIIFGGYHANPINEFLQIPPITPSNVHVLGPKEQDRNPN